MAIQTVQYLKDKFSCGKIPIQQDFYDFIDTAVQDSSTWDSVFTTVCSNSAIWSGEFCDVLVSLSAIDACTNDTIDVRANLDLPTYNINVSSINAIEGHFTYISAVSTVVQYTNIIVSELSGFMGMGSDFDQQVPASITPGVNNITLSGLGLSSTSWGSFGGDIKSDGIIYASCGNSEDWCEAAAGNFCDTTINANTLSACSGVIGLSGSIEVTDCVITDCIQSRDYLPISLSQYSTAQFISALPGTDFLNDGSTLTYSPISGTLWVIESDPGGSEWDFREYDTENYALQQEVIGSNFFDIEGMCWISGNYFAVVEERTAASPNDDRLEEFFDVTRFYLSGQTTIDKNDWNTDSIYMPSSYHRNNGPEGITYDQARDIFYICKEGVGYRAGNDTGRSWTPGSSAMGVFSIDLNAGGQISAVELFNAIEQLSAHFHSYPLSGDLSDIYYNNVTEQLFILADEGHSLFQTDLNGNAVETLSLSAYDAPQPEGIAFDPSHARMWIMSEAGASNDGNRLYELIRDYSLINIYDGIAISRLVAAPLISASCGTSDDWCSTYTTVSTNSATWDSTYTTVNTNSADWDSTHTTVNTNSATWDSHADLSEVAAASGGWNSTETTVNTTSADWALKSAYNEFSDINRFYDHVAIGSQASASNEGHTLHVMGSGGVAFNNVSGNLAMYMASLTGHAAQTYYQEIDPISGHSNKWTMGMGASGDFSIGGWHSPNLSNGNAYVYLDFDNNYVGIMESVPKTPLDVYGIASADNAVSGRHLVNYQTMDSFVTAATAGIPTGGSDVSSLSGNWESTYTTVQANSATWEAGGGSVFGNLTADNIQINSTVVFAAEYDNGVAGVAETIDWNNGNKQKSSLSGNSTYTFVAPSGVGNFLLKVAQLSGSDSITWPANVLWPSGTAPTLTTTASAIDIVTFYYDNVDYYGVASLDFQ